MTREKREELALLVESVADLGYESNGPAGWVSPLAPGEPEKLLKIAAELRKTCAWTEDEDGNWDTGCGNKHIHELPYGGMRFCGYCGGTLVEAPYTAPEDDDGA